MLASAGTIETVAAAVEEHGLETLVVDPVRFPGAVFIVLVYAFPFSDLVR